MTRIRGFRQLEVWKEEHQLALMLYAAAKPLPQDGRFGLVSQMRRAAVSVPASIPEGFKRRGVRDKVSFYSVAEGWLEELKYFFILAVDLTYLSVTDDVMEQPHCGGRLLHGLIRSPERRLP